MKDYISCSFRGFNLKIPKEFADQEFLKVCCNGPLGGNTFFKRVPSSQYALVYYFKYKEKTYFYKSFLHRNCLEPIKEIFRGSRAERALRGHLLLQENGLCTPQVIVVGKKGSHNFMVTNAVLNAQDIHIYIKNFSNPLISKKKIAAKRIAIHQLGHMVGRMHAINICHGDLRCGNIEVDVSDPCYLHYILLDNERTIKYWRLPVHKRLSNIVQLNMINDTIITRTDRLRFFQAYLTENPDLNSHRKLWIRRILKKTAKRFARKHGK